MQFPIIKVKNNFSLKVLVILALCFSVFSGFSKSTSQSVFQNKSWQIIKSTQDELILTYTSFLRSVDTIYTNDGKQTLMPVIDNAFSGQTQPGIETELLSNKNISVPGPDCYQIEDIKVENILKIPGTITPVPDYYIDKSPSYFINDVFYKTYKPNWVSIKYEGIARDRHIAQICVTAAKFNPEENTIEIPGKITIRIKFKTQNTEQKFSTNIDPLSAISSINYSVGNNWRVSPEIFHSKQNNKFEKNKKSDEILSEGKWIKIAVDNEGIYKIEPSMLSSLGVNIPKSEIPTIKIYGNGGNDLSERVSDASNNLMNEQEIIVKTSGSGDLSQIIFYGSPANGFKYDTVSSKFSHFINHYSNINYYLMTWGGATGKRVDPIPTPSGEVKNNPLTYLNRIFFEEEINNPFKTGAGRVWFGGSLFPRVFRTQLNNLDRNGQVKYRISVAHRADSPGYFSVTENAKELSKINLIPNYGEYVDATSNVQESILPASDIASDDFSILKFSYFNPKGGTNAIGFFDYYEISYPRYFIPINNEISFFSEPTLTGITEFSINGFSGSDIYGFDISNLKSPKQITNISNTGGMFLFRENLDTNRPHKYFISPVLKTPKLETTDIGYLRQNQETANVILICHPSLYNSALKYKEYRESHDTLKVLVVRTDYIFNEFGSGIADPTAIRDFISYTFSNWNVKPTYIILWGDGHFDYKNISSKKVNLVLPYESEDSDTFDAVASYTSDDYFVRVFGEDKLVDLCIGRIPINSDEQGEWIVRKIEKYETGSSKDSWRDWVTLMADDSPTSNNQFDGYLHSSQSETLSMSYIPNDLRQKKIYLAEYPTDNLSGGGRRKPKVMDALVSWVNTNGTLILNWIGHGNPRVWAHEEVFERSVTIPQLTNIDKQFFLVAATCDFGRFDEPDVNSGSEDLFTSEIGGAIGVLASARAVLAGANAALTNSFYELMFTRNPLTKRYSRLGDVMFALKQEKFSDNDEKYLLIGDPTIKLLIPDYSVRIDSINGIDVTNDTAKTQLKALSDVHLSCSIINNLTESVETGFDGLAILSILDSDVGIQALDIDGTIHNILKEGGALNINSANVINGRFEANCIIPKDISFSNQQGRIYVYAYSDNNEYAKGISRSFVIGGVDSTQSNDGEGPVISLYLDSRKFIQGDLVQKNPLLIVDLLDSSGINTTGLGIGHRIEAWIDDNPVAIDLTGKFVTSPGDFRAGTAEDYLRNLEPGVHSVKVRAWDVFNNYSMNQTNFRLEPEENSIVISKILSYPNPADNNTIFSFNHNIVPPFFVNIKVFNVIGKEIADISGDINSLHNAELNWDCRDFSGEVLPIGIYIYRIYVITNKGYQGEATGKLTVSH
ncbi:MAG: type IX secretion system sortase PorU [Ignavibacteriae bacterium]|nr:type IX secretion system sortase PorU [Ignavibacteriota bacterium]